MKARERLGDALTRSVSRRGRLHHLWWVTTDRGWIKVWRPLCWLRGYHVPHHTDVHFECCVTCWKHLWGRRSGVPNPYRHLDRAPLRRPRW